MSYVCPGLVVSSACLSWVCCVQYLSFLVLVCLGSVTVLKHSPLYRYIRNLLEGCAVKLVSLKLKVSLPYYIFPGPFRGRGRPGPPLFGQGRGWGPLKILRPLNPESSAHLTPSCPSQSTFRLLRRWSRRFFRALGVSGNSENRRYHRRKRREVH